MFTCTFDNIEKYKCNVIVSSDKISFKIVNYKKEKRKKISYII